MVLCIWYKENSRHVVIYTLRFYDLRVYRKWSVRIFSHLNFGHLDVLIVISFVFCKLLSKQDATWYPHSTQAKQPRVCFDSKSWYSESVALSIIWNVCHFFKISVASFYKKTPPKKQKKITKSSKCNCQCKPCYTNVQQR